MNDKINLLEEKTKKLENLQKKKYLAFISIASLLVYILVAVGIFYYWHSLEKKAKKIISQIKNKEEIITKQKIQEQSYLSFKHRLSQVEKIFKIKPSPEKTLDALNSNFPQNITLKALEFQKTTNSLNFSLQAQNSQAVSEFLKVLKDKNKLGQHLTKIEVQGIHQDKKLTYTLQINAKLKENETKKN